MLENLIVNAVHLASNPDSIDYGKFFAKNGVGFLKGFFAGFISSSILLPYSSYDNIIMNSFIGGAAVTAGYTILDYALNSSVNVFEDGLGTFAGAFTGTHVTQNFKHILEKSIDEKIVRLIAIFKKDILFYFLGLIIAFVTQTKLFLKKAPTDARVSFKRFIKFQKI
ncbi:MAG TPA: hypothetical protein ENN30_00400 [Candidatus Woesearchaeota archaeon]|nr:hypothetical protein [Candidatus Woesearchaeota archaeon]